MVIRSGNARRRPTTPSSSSKRTRSTQERKSLNYWVENGDVFVSAIFNGGDLSCVRIEFHKETSRIPSLKNSKLPGRNFLNPETLNRLRAMDALYLRSTRVYNDSNLSFGDQKVMGLLVCNKRPVRFDLDNCVAAVKDWCEPATKRGRGWGVGLVDDDSKLNIIAAHAEDLGLTLDHSLLILRPMADVQGTFKGWINKLFL